MLATKPKRTIRCGADHNLEGTRIQKQYCGNQNEVAETRKQTPSNHVTCGEHREHVGISETFQNITTHLKDEFP